MHVSETSKIRHIMLPYCQGVTLDVGCGPDKIKPDALGVDLRPLPYVDIVADISNLHEELLKQGYENVDTVFSSHCLEHLKDDQAALHSWISILKKGGYLCLYLPDDRFYDNRSNPEHLSYYTYFDFMNMFHDTFPFMKVIKSGPHVGPDKYSFYLIAQK